MGECEASYWASVIPRIYHAEWERWATGVPTTTRLVGSADKDGAMALEGHDLNRTTPKGFIRIVSRRVTISKAEVAFSSTPTTSRGSPRTLICDAQSFGVLMGSLDVTLRWFLRISKLLRKGGNAGIYKYFVKVGLPPSGL